MVKQGADPGLTLRVYLSEGCPVCADAGMILEMIRTHVPELRIEVVDVEDASVEVPDFVFSVPTYCVNGRIVSLGNPAVDFVPRLRDLLQEAERG